MQVQGSITQDGGMDIMFSRRALVMDGYLEFASIAAFGVLTWYSCRIFGESFGIYFGYRLVYFGLTG